MLHRKDFKTQKEYEYYYNRLPKVKKMKSRYNHTPQARENRSRYDKSPKGKIQQKKKWLRYNFKLTLEEYNQMFVKQKGCCFICGIHQSELKISLAVDHNHKTGRIRGLLCQKCNVGLGLFQDSIDILAKALKYLKKFNYVK